VTLACVAVFPDLSVGDHNGRAKQYTRAIEPTWGVPAEIHRPAILEINIRMHQPFKQEDLTTTLASRAQLTNQALISGRVNSAACDLTKSYILIGFAPVSLNTSSVIRS
jgi:hypothetical protein